ELPNDRSVWELESGLTTIVIPIDMYDSAWQTVEFIYTSLGGEKWITIGTTDIAYREYDMVYENWRVLIYHVFDELSVEEIICEINPVPDAFTPNGDGVNDFWQPDFDLGQVEYRLYDRWGKEIISGSLGPGDRMEIPEVSEGVYFLKAEQVSNGEVLCTKAKAVHVFR